MKTKPLPFNKRTSPVLFKEKGMCMKGGLYPVKINGKTYYQVKFPGMMPDWFIGPYETVNRGLKNKGGSNEPNGNGKRNHEDTGD